VVSGRLSFIINRQLLLRYTLEKEAGEGEGRLDVGTSRIACPATVSTARSNGPVVARQRRKMDVSMATAAAAAAGA